VCKFTVACNRFFKQGEETQKEVSCFDVSCWTTRLAEVCGEYLKMGEGKDGEAGTAAAPAETSGGQAQEEAELKEAAGF